MIRFIDTEPDKNKHTALCSCEFCLDMKKVVFGDMPKKFRDEFKQINPLLHEILVTDGIWPD